MPLWKLKHTEWNLFYKKLHLVAHALARTVEGTIQKRAKKSADNGLLMNLTDLSYDSREHSWTDLILKTKQKHPL